MWGIKLVKDEKAAREKGNEYIYIFFSSEFDLGFLIRGNRGHRCHIQFKLSQKAGWSLLWNCSPTYSVCCGWEFTAWAESWIKHFLFFIACNLHLPMNLRGEPVCFWIVHVYALFAVLLLVYLQLKVPHPAHLADIYLELLLSLWMGVGRFPVIAVDVWIRLREVMVTVLQGWRKYAFISTLLPVNKWNAYRKGTSIWS